jgi:hypothetical protein
MPSKSKAQHNFMAAVANNPQFAKRAGVPQSVGREYMKADEGRKFEGGGPVSNCGTKRMKKGGRASMDTGSRPGTSGRKDYNPDAGLMEGMAAPGMNYGGKVKKMNKGGMCRGNGIAQRGQGRINLR